MRTTVTIPLRLDSMANLRLHWAMRHKVVRKHRQAMIVVPSHPLPCAVRLTRIAPRKLDDDNLVAAFKGCRDGIADRLGVKDNDPRVTWRYAQETGGKGVYAMRIDMWEL